MSTSLDEYRARLRETPQGQSRINELKGMAQEVPRMAALTGDKNWDYYLRFIEAHIKAAERMVEAKREQAAALVLVDEDKAKVAAVLVTVYQTRAETLREMILLPKWIRESGERAQKAVAELEASL
jgi:hypothetical protein